MTPDARIACSIESMRMCTAGSWRASSRAIVVFPVPGKPARTIKIVNAISCIVAPATFSDILPDMTELPIACTLTPAALRARREGLLTELVRRADAHESSPGGHRLRFAAEADTLSIIAQTVEAERQCCRFLRFQITVEPDGGPIWLELSGPSGTGAFVSALMDA